MQAVPHPVLQGALERLFSLKAQTVHDPQQQLIFIPGDEKTPQPAGNPPEFVGSIWVHIVQDRLRYMPVLTGAQAQSP